jgi:tetratricopeptide (TPR) repeat protein
LLGKNTALSVRAATICYYIQGLCAATNRDYKSSYLKFNKTKEILDKNPKLKKDLGQRYILTLSHLLNCYKDERDFEMVQSVINDLNHLRNDKSFQSLDLKIKLFGICFNEQIYLYNQLGEYQKAITYFDATNQEKPNLINSFNKEQLIVMYFNMANAYFGNRDFKNALKCINEIINDNESNLRQDIYSFSRILNIFIHYELGNFEYLDYTMKSTSRFFKKTQKDYHFEKVIIQNISKLMRVEDIDARYNLYEAFAQDVEELLEQPEEKVILAYFNLPEWLNRKLN